MYVIVLLGIVDCAVESSDSRSLFHYVDKCIK